MWYWSLHGMFHLLQHERYSSLINATLPEVASDSTVIDVPAPIFTCFGVLKKTFNGDV